MYVMHHGSGGSSIGSRITDTIGPIMDMIDALTKPREAL